MNQPFKSNRTARILGAFASVCTSVLLFVAVVSLSEPQAGSGAKQIAKTPVVAVAG